MSKRTPGPWEVKKDDDSWRIRQKGSVKRRPGFTLERPVGEGFQEKYDAILAAAAPDLLEALIDCRRALELANFTEELAVVNAAIARATGEQP